MGLTPLSLRITNFRSVRGTQTFEFPQEPGLYFMRGINDVEERLGANGAGKSTVWDALTWCWFNKTASGLRAGDVCNWGAGKGTEVALSFWVNDAGGPMATVTRTWGPISWTLDLDGERTDLTKEKDNPALAWLALDIDQWLSCVLMAQDQPMFLDLKREAQAALFSSVVGADRWLDHSARSSRLAADEDRKVREHERDLARLQGELDAAGRQDFRQSSEEYEERRSSLLTEMEERHEQFLARRRALKDELEGAQERETNARAWVAKAQPGAGLEKDHGKARAEVSDFGMLAAEERGRAQGLRDQLARLAEKDCPVCGQRMSRDHRIRETRKLEAELRKADEAAGRYEREQVASEERADRLGADLDAQTAELEKARAALDDAQRTLGNARRELDRLDRELDRLEDEHERMKAGRNPYADLEERARADGRRLRDEIDRARRRLDEAAERQSLFQFWVRGFKDVRLMKMDDALTELEIEANSGVDALGLLGWELQFQVDRETKGGKIERGFNCLVRSPANEKQVPWEAWSGGEGQRLRLAAAMGLADLTRSRTGASIPLEVWDEPTRGLSPQGARDLLECLAERARRERRVVYLVDHRAHDFGGFAGGCTVRKTAQGTIVEDGIDTA